MYLWEFSTYLSSIGKLKAGLTRAELKEQQRLNEKLDEEINALGGDLELYRIENPEIASLKQPKQHVIPAAQRCVYKQSDSVLDVRTAFDEWRGLVTIIFCLLMFQLFESWQIEVRTVLEWVKGITFNGRPITGDHIAGGVIGLTMNTVVTWLFLRFGLKWFRLEVLTQRRLIVRFNRRTRKVWLHRPKSCGGIVALDWDDLFAVVPTRPSPGRSGAPFILMSWFKGYGTDRDETAYVGRGNMNDDELCSLWEYIRRFMEAADSLPQASSKELAPRFPWPWHSLYAPWTFFLPALKQMPVLWAVFVLLLPVMLVWGIFHWISLLLCWEPRFPKESD